LALAAEPADQGGRVLLHGLAATTVVATPVLRQAAEYAERDADRHQSPCCPVRPRPRPGASTAALAWPPGNNNPPVTQLVAIAAEVRDHKANAGRVPGTAAKTAPPPPPRRLAAPSALQATFARLTISRSRLS
jgi:hypothetical protein